VSARVERDQAGRFVRSFGVIIDVTEQKRMAIALQQAQKMEAVGQMTGGVAHDFNNLLTVVVGNLDLIAAGAHDGAQVQKRVAAALRAAERGSALTQQLLAFSRRQMLRPEIVNPNRILKEFTPLIQQAAGEAVEVQTILSPTLDPCRLDRAQFEAAILNLVVNARDAMPGGGRITIETRNLDIEADEPDAVPPVSAGSYALVAIADTGEGMSPEILQRVFEPFFTTKEVGRGSGLGLSMVYGFVSQSGGHVQIDSEVGVGTTVRLYLPRTTERTAPAPHRHTQAARSATGSETILLVEDNPEVLEVGSGMLRALGYEVAVARDAEEALALLRSDRRFHALFSDVIMPGMTGDQLAQEARILRPEIKVLLTSGFAAQLAAEGGRLRGFPVIPKPYRQAELAERLRELLED
jgi:nitrogen-specific signal transduction histidine kinase